MSFDGFRALNALTLYVDTGELRCIIGPNGAGKTTMMDVITGKTSPEKGTDLLFGTLFRLFRKINLSLRFPLIFMRERLLGY